VNATLTREEWKAVWSAGSVLNPSIESAGQSDKGHTFTVEGSYYEFAESVVRLRDAELKQRLAIRMAECLQSEVSRIYESETIAESIRQPKSRSAVS